MALTIDLNCDMGESYGAWTMGHDLEILPYVTSANIACGYHAGDPSTMRRTVEAALQNGVAVGAHPSLPDLAGFGRRAMDVNASEVYDMVVYQVGALSAVAASQGARLHHVKAHGALYNMAAKQPELADAIARAVRDVDPSLILYALASSAQVDAAREAGLQVAQEVFGDRTYQDDGALTSRKRPDAMIVDPEAAVRLVVRMITEGKVESTQGTEVAVQADTLCIHGDQPGALVFARAICAGLQQAGIGICTIPQGSAGV